MSKNLATVLALAVFVGVGLGLALVALGWFLVPATSVLDIGATMAVLILYGVFGGLFPRRLYHVNPQILRLAVGFGLGAGAVFVGEMLWEYLTLPADNTSLGLIEFGSVLGLYFCASVVVAYQSGQVRQGVWTAIGSAMIGSLIWFIAVLIIFYTFRGTSQQAQVFRAEGNYEDFARSGMTDFDTFIMEDFMGAGFFHLLLGPLITLLLGMLGGLLGKVGARFRQT